VILTFRPVDATSKDPGAVSLTIPLLSVDLDGPSEHFCSLQDLFSNGLSTSAQYEDVFVQFPALQLTLRF
jgi:hypothetical protein